MAEATTVMDPAAAGQGDESSTQVSTIPTSGPMAILYRVTGGQSLRQVMPGAIGIVVALAGIVFFVVSQQPERTTLYASLPEAEKSRVIDALKNAGVDVALDPTTGDVIVPVRDYHSSRMTLAAQGLPASIPDGYDSLNNIPMGSSRSVEQVRLKQTQEIELARSISEIEGVVTAECILRFLKNLSLHEPLRPRQHRCSCRWRMGDLYRGSRLMPLFIWCPLRFLSWRRMRSPLSTNMAIFYRGRPRTALACCQTRNLNTASVSRIFIATA